MVETLSETTLPQANEVTTKVMEKLLRKVAELEIMLLSMKIEHSG